MNVTTLKSKATTAVIHAYFFPEERSAPRLRSHILV